MAASTRHASRYWVGVAIALAVGLLLGGNAPPAAPVTAHAAPERATTGADRSLTGSASVLAQTAVTIRDGSFTPAEITVGTGTTATWTNAGRATHTVTSQGAWDSGRLAPSATWSMLFETPGTFEYLCALHPATMRGRVVVQAPAEPTAEPPAAVPPPSAPPQAAPPGAISPGATLQPPTDDRGTGPGFAGVGALTGTGAATARLEPQRDSGVTGEATLLQAGDTTTVTVVLEGLAPSSAHAGHIHDGGCDRPVLYPLLVITADEAGRGRATSTVQAALDATTWWVQYHASDGPPGPGIVCGPAQAGN